MIYKYNVMIPLVYNSHELYTKTPESEGRFMLEKPIEHLLEVKFITHDLAAMGEDMVCFDDCIKVMIYNTYEEDNDNSIAQSYSRVAPELICEIKGLLVDEEIYARKFTDKIVDRICKEISFVFIRHNSNRHLFQPRVEADWSRLKYTKEKYEPFLTKKQELIFKKKNEDKIVQIEDYIHFKESLFMTAIVRIPESEFDVEFCLRPHSEAVEYLMNEYYSALGAELVKSKFFHLFSMIEYCEREYKEHNGACSLLNEQTVDDIIEDLRKHDIMKHCYKDGQDNGSVREVIISRIKKTLLDVNDIGRNKKLVNILHWMGIDSYLCYGKKVVIDEKFIRKLTQLRNKSFHGAAESKTDSSARYREVVEMLLYIGEQIINFVRLNERSAQPRRIQFLIEGKC